MMTRLFKPNRRGASVFEYAFLIVLVLSTLFVFRSYILRSFNGRYKTIGDSYGFGRQYDPKRTMACGYDDRINVWFDEACYDNERTKCAPGDNECEISILQGIKCRLNDDLCNKL